MNLMHDFQEQKRKKVHFIEKQLHIYCPKGAKEYSVLIEAMSYSLFGSGKRLRPLIMAETYALFDTKGDIYEAKSLGIYPFMAAMEMIHAYSLIHDDLPALDNDDLRRGKPTNHIAFGEDIAILAGDGLLNSAFEAACAAFSLESDAARVGRAIGILASKAGVNGMIGGQVIDVTTEGVKNPIEVLEMIYKMKTAALLEASMMIGATLAGASAEDVATVESAARKIGIAFQIQDDILDVLGIQEILGKPVFSDRRNQKSTYVSLMGTEEAQKEVERLSLEAISELAGLAGENPFLMQLLTELIQREK